MSHSKWIFVVLLTLTLGFQSCKKGCNNPKAFNFQANAKENDGSCLFCDSMSYIYNNQSDYIQDNNSSSPFQGQYVLTAIVNQNRVYYSGNGCKILGKINTSSGTSCSYFSYVLMINNTTNRTIIYSGNIDAILYNTTAVRYHASSLVIPAYGTDSVFMGSACSYSSSFDIHTTVESLQYQ